MIDLAVILFYFAAVLAIGVLVARGVETGDDLFLAGRRLSWPEIGGSLFASNISSTTLIGLAGAAYTSGIAVSNFEWMAGVVLVFMGFFVIPIFLKSRITTIPEYLQLRFDRRARLYFSAITILLTIIVDTAGGIYAGAVVLQTFFPDLVLWQTCFALALVAGLYTAAGGLAAVVYTDVIQTVVLIVGSTILTIIVFGQFGYSWEAAKAAIPEGHLSLIRPLDDDSLPWLGTLVGVPVLGFWYWATNQYITQRVLGARSVRHAQWGANLGGLLKLLPLFIMVLPGAMAIGLFPDIENGDEVFPTLVREMLPVGLTGLVLAGLVAAIMSSIDSTLNSASTLVIKDFVEAPETPIEPKRVGRLGRITTLTLMLVAAVWAPQIASFGGLWNYLQQAFSILVPPVAAVFLLGIFWDRGGRQSAIWTLVSGHIVGLALFLATDAGWWPLHYTVNVGLMTAFSVLVFVVVALNEGYPEHAKTDGLTFEPGMSPEDDLALWKRPGVQGFVILALTAAMIVAFW
ncbi:sodium:solute symporter [Rubrimonas cliftonensis]|uniref:sodium:solute symporter n=1 Tax=Rubrimonas cliftonensis TaxID=89524 RepID=UPI001C316ACC|nr:sodium:solute symporter [Rubrimonas cliftonensis]